MFVYLYFSALITFQSAEHRVGAVEQESRDLLGTAAPRARRRRTHRGSVMKHDFVCRCDPYAASAPTLQCAPSESTNCARTPPESCFFGGMLKSTPFALMSR